VIVPRCRPSSAAFTLTEVLVVLATTFVIMMICGVTIATAMRISRSGMKGLDALVTANALADQFRADVARATAAPAEFGRYKAGPSCLLLRTGKDDDYVVYRWEEGVLERSLLARVRPDRRQIAIGSNTFLPEFDRTGIPRGIVTLRLTETRPKPGRPIEISAAIGGLVR
jgi:hypothetical protein